MLAESSKTKQFTGLVTFRMVIKLNVQLDRGF